jgi:thiol-disulfide isomerase/thioredoxin
MSDQGRPIPSRRRVTAGLAGLIGLGGAGQTSAQAPFDGLPLDRLSRLDRGRLSPAVLPAGTRIVAFYFGAAWCGPCRAFVPELKAAYPRLRAAARPVEIVFASDDTSRASMTDYMIQSRMPWLALPHETARRDPAIQALRGLALPGFKAIGSDGSVVVDSWVRPGDSRPRQTLERLLALAGAPRR